MKMISMTRVLLAAGLTVGLGCGMAHAQAGQDMKDAGHETKQAAKDTGHATKTTAKKVGHKTKKVAKATAHRTENAGDALKGEPPQH
ncbi:MAG: hypothetical protein M3O31_05690 [Acidobacteriota bacterium]|nr:hypothetical protein [Acidobacteriota bacterium]